MPNVLLFIVVILLPLAICGQSAAKPEVDSRSAFEIILAKVRTSQAEALKSFAQNAQSDPVFVRRLQKASDIANSIKTRRSLIAFLLEPPDVGDRYEESLRLQWVLILQNEQIADELQQRRPAPRGKGVLLQ
jgi:hypothetical protein